MSNPVTEGRAPVEPHRPGGRGGHLLDAEPVAGRIGGRCPGDRMAGGGGDKAFELALLGRGQLLALVEGPVPGGHVLQ